MNLDHVTEKAHAGANLLYAWRFVFVLGVGLLARLPVVQGAPAQVDAAITHQLIRGFGGATAFMPTTPLGNADLDTLFGNGPGQIGFTWLRIRLASDPDWRAVELSNARGAVARGANVIATPWSPPASMKDNENIVGGSLLPSAYGDYANYLNDFARYMAANGAPLYAVSVQNEPDISVTYESCDWTAAQLLAFCRSNAAAITTTRVIVPESFQFNHAMSDALLNDASATAAIDIVGGHIYGGGLTAYPLAVSRGKEVWMTEHLDLSTDWSGALGTGKEIHDCLATAEFNSYFWWYLKRYYGPLGEDGVVTKRGWVMAQFAKFIRPGLVRIAATANPSAGVYVSAYEGDKLVIVAINQGDTSFAQSFAVANVTVAEMTPWMTSATASLQPQPVIPVSGGEFSATLPPQSITTFVGDVVVRAPAVLASPQSHTVNLGGTAVFDVAVDAAWPTYQWSHEGVAIPGATSRLLTLRNVGASDAGHYAVTISNSGGSITSAAATLTLSPGAASRLINLSTRSEVGTNDNVQIAGFVIRGSQPKRLLIRATGPTLNTSFGVTGVLADPALEVRDSATGAIVAANDNWDAALDATFTSVGAFGWPRGSKDAAVLTTLPPGAYTAIVTGQDGGTGIALVEVYDADATADSAMINISTRSLVGSGDYVQIAGFAIAGQAARTVVIRASGPALRKQFGLVGTVSDPVIELHRQGSDAILASNDDWASELAPHFSAVGAFSWLTESKDAALVTTLDPGLYTVVVRGKTTTSGVALVEVYAE